MNVNVMTAVDPGEPNPEGFCAGHGFGKADIFEPDSSFWSSLRLLRSAIGTPLWYDAES